MARFHGTVDSIAPLLFLRNPNDLPVTINMPALENSKDTFYFLTDVLMKGIYYIVTNDYSNCQVVNLSEVNIQTFFVAIRKLKNINVQTNVRIIGAVMNNSEVRNIMVNSMNAVKELPNDLRLEEYSFDMPLNSSIYNISFSTPVFG